MMIWIWSFMFMFLKDDLRVKKWWFGVRCFSLKDGCSYVWDFGKIIWICEGGDLDLGVDDDDMDLRYDDLDLGF